MFIGSFSFRLPLLKKNVTVRPARALVETVFICSGAFFVGVMHPLLAFVILFVTLMRNTRPISRPVCLLVNALTIILMLYSIDSIAVLFLFLIFAGMQYVLMFFAALALFNAPIVRYRPLELGLFHGLLMGVIVILFVETTVMVLSPGEAACAQCRQIRGGDLVVDHQKLDNLNLTPRFLRLDPQEKTLFVGYRFPFFNNKPELEDVYGLLIVDTDTGEITNPYLSGGEVIGMAFDPIVDAMICLLVYKNGGPDNIDCWLNWIARDGRIVDRVPIPSIPWNEYFGAILPDEQTVTIYTGKGVSERVDRATGTVTLVPNEYAQAPAAATNYMQFGHECYFCYGGSLIELFIQPGVILSDLQTGKILRSSPHIPFGTYVLEYDRVRDEIYTNTQFSGTLWVMDRQLHPLRQVKTGGVVRALALDVRARRGYIAHYVRGDVVSFDMDTGIVRETIPLVKSVRSMVVDRNGMLYVGSGCGVFRFHPDVWNPPSAGGIQYKTMY